MLASELALADVDVAIDAPDAVLIRPDGHVVWTGDQTQSGLNDTLACWFGPPSEA